ncbi:type I polyketide synthase [Acetivibrio cellulolyticus]|uniref:type I polyketide synthase n=1 Tax=Acetivibrio cellulolyticus TaxID=35830 RepID=UPI0001E3052D|nr:type I polyketide synthase [Acetivibrio cellulolyticus]
MGKIKDDKKLSIAYGGEISGVFCDKSNIGRILIDTAEVYGDKGITFIKNDDSEIRLTYKEIYDRALIRLGGLQRAGFEKGQYAIVIIDESIDFVITFWACVLGGIIPAPLAYPPLSSNVKNASLQKLYAVWDTLKRPVILSDSSLVENGKDIETTLCIDGMQIIEAESLDEGETRGSIELAEPHTPAFIQFSSGSTNTPKGVILTHHNLLTNVEAIIVSGKLNSEKISLSWMPFHHDMGLIGFHLTIIAAGMEQYNITPFKFVKKPTLWLDLVSKHKINITGSPNFGYRLLLNRVKEEQLKTWDLRSLEFIYNGAEPISVPLMQEFMETLAVCGLKSTSMFPVYGMAEACLAVCFPPVGSNPEVHSIDRHKLVAASKVEEVSKTNKNSLLIIDEGYPVNGINVRITNENGEVVQEGIVGEIQISGNNVTSGYINNPKATAESFQDNWLKTGDMGFMLNGRLSVVGRLKDIIFINGQNFFAHDIEARIEEIDGVEPGKVVACGWHGEAEGIEKTAIFSVTRTSKEKELYTKIVRHINETMGISVDYIVSVKTIPKTTSGKVQRFKLIEDFINGKYESKTFKASDLMLEVIPEPTISVRKEIKAIDADEYTEKVRAIWAKVLERPLENIPHDQPFMSLGGTSIKAIQVLGLLEDEFKLSLTHDILLNCRTVNEMKEYIQDLVSGNKLLPGSSRPVLAEVTNKGLENGDIAVISMSCRFPEASSPEEFWNNIMEGKCSINDIPGDRWNINDYYSAEGGFGKTYCDKGAFIENPYRFDADLFNISEKEAVIMDPQQRLILELVLELIEDAGYSRKKVSGKNIGLFVGASTNSYYEFHLNTLNRLNLQRFDSFSSLTKEQQDMIMQEWKSKLGVTDEHTNILVDNILNMIAARASQEFNFKGPSLVVDSACSSSLVAIHLACEAIKKGECEMAIAGGVNLLLTPTPYIYFSNAGALSAKGSSRVFDADADGFIPGEGAGLIMLKPLEKAIADKNQILAVIKGSEVNNDGHSIGVMSPNPDGQKAVIESLYVRSGISPESVQYVEAHGTGTKIGDPSEVRALDNAYSGWDLKKQSIAIGSVKANIGHLLSAAGIASFMKIVLALKNKKMPPNVNLSEPNPMIKFDKTPFYLLKDTADWNIAEGLPRRAAINSFGFGGTNSHMIVEEAPLEAQTVSEIRTVRSNHVMCLSANSETALGQKIQNIIEFLEKNKHYDLGDICYTENVLRTQYKNRLSVVASSVDDLIGKLKKASVSDKADKFVPKVALMFTGQGSQYVGMGRELYNNLPAFRKYVDECSEAFYPHINEKITDLIYGENANEKYLSQTNITQPIVFTMDYSLGRLILELGVEPKYVLGHSLGEWVAACISGAVSLKDAARIVSLRGKLMSEIKSSGAMAAVFTKESSLEPLLEAYEGTLWVASYNITHQVVSGQAEAMDRFLADLQTKGIVAKRLNVSQAFHTPLMSSMLEEFRKELEVTTFNAPSIPVVSNITAEVMERTFDAEYWLNHILGAVRFEQSIKYVVGKGVNTLVECGPDKVLTGMANAFASADKKLVLPSMDRKNDNWASLLDTLGKLYSNGVKVQWDELEKDNSYEKVPLPSYPFENRTFKPDFGDSTYRSTYSGNLDNWFYEWDWKSEPEAVSSALGNGAVIVFNDTKGIGNELGNKLRTENRPVYFVNPGKEFNYDGVRNFTINPESEGDYSILLEKINGEISSVIHLWNCSKGSMAAETFLSESSALYEGSYSILFMCKALIQHKADRFRFMSVTNNAFCLTNQSCVENPHQYIAASLAQAIDIENREIDAYIIDVNRSEYESDVELAETLINELNSKINSESIVAIRNKQRFVRVLEKATINKNTSDFVLEDGETYIITGGAGHIGGEIAKAFAKQAKVNVVLTGRRKLQEGEEKEKDERIELIQSLEQLGANVMYSAVDVADKDQMEELVRSINAKFGAIHGVVHAAGTLDNSSDKLLKKDIDVIKRVLAPKVQGTVITDLVTRKEPLKFFVTLSSISASKKVWSAGLGEYAAANAYLDGYSYFREREGAPGRSLSINYSLWANDGMVKAFGELSVLAIKSQGLEPLPSDGAVKAFMKAMSCGGKNALHIFDKKEEKKAEKAVELSSGNAEATGTRKVICKSAQEIRSIVFKVIADQLNISTDELEIGANFTEIGIDSVGAVKITSEIGKMINVELYPTLIFEYQTPQELSEYIEKTYASDVTNEFDDEAKNINSAVSKDELQDIAIIGMSLRIPGASNLDEYWDLLKNGKCTIREVPEERWSCADHFNPDVKSQHTTYCNKGGFIDKPYDFDPMFFGMSPNEAEVTDPQQRLFLQIAWEALQQAGYGGKHRTSKIGIFVGCEQNTYMEHFAGYCSYMVIKDKLKNSEIFNNIDEKGRKEILSNIINVLKPANMVSDSVAGNSLNEIAARVSHCLNLTGPSLVVNSACSSSLVSLHMACESIRSGASEMAIAGGVSLNLSPSPFVGLSKVTALSPTGVCSPFDKNANGMVLAEGTSVVLLKPLKHALRDGDHIYAVIKGSAINNDGRSQGITAPKPQGQAEAIRNAYLQAGIDPETVSYIETHGTATPLGDPIEVEGMTKAFRSFTSKNNFCGIGSVKSSIGHMLSAAGITSLIKVALSLKNKTIPHTINYDQPNPNIDFKNSPFYVVDKHPREWKAAGDTPLRAGVNAFGFGGTNAHVILEEAPQYNESDCDSVNEDMVHMMLLTGRTEKVIKTVAGNLKRYIEQNPDSNIGSICYTNNISQKEQSLKTAAVIKSRGNLLSVLSAIENGSEQGDIIKGRSNPNRQTLAHVIMDGGLMLCNEEIELLSTRFAVFKSAYRDCKNKILEGIGSNSGSGIKEKVESIAVQYAVGMLLEHLGVTPKCIIGQGMGILAGIMLTGLATFKNIAEFLLGKGIQINNSEDKAEICWKCQVITPLGTISRIEDSISYAEASINNNSTFTAGFEGVNNNDALICCGCSSTLISIISALGYGKQIIELKFSEESIIGALAKLYVSGVDFNPAKLYNGTQRRIPLPTYPFENAEYKVTFKDEELELDERPMAEPIKLDILHNSPVGNEPVQRNDKKRGLIKIIV